MTTLEETKKDTIAFMKQIFSKKVVDNCLEKNCFIAIHKKNNIDYLLIDYNTPEATCINGLKRYGELLFKKLSDAKCKANYLN